MYTDDEMEGQSVKSYTDDETGEETEEEHHTLTDQESKFYTRKFEGIL